MAPDLLVSEEEAEDCSGLVREARHLTHNWLRMFVIEELESVTRSACFEWRLSFWTAMTSRRRFETASFDC
jgi:hypothetical protein